jgi:alpha-methylacyl-CoA racemase
MREDGLWNNQQGQNWLDGGAPFYSVYRCKDSSKFFTVACIDNRFYDNFLTVLKD